MMISSANSINSHNLLLYLDPTADVYGQLQTSIDVSLRSASPPSIKRSGTAELFSPEGPTTAALKYSRTFTPSTYGIWKSDTGFPSLHGCHRIERGQLLTNTEMAGFHSVISYMLASINNDVKK